MEAFLSKKKGSVDRQTLSFSVGSQQEHAAVLEKKIRREHGVWCPITKLFRNNLNLPIIITHEVKEEEQLT